MMSGSLVFVNFIERDLNPFSTLFFTFTFSFILLAVFQFNKNKLIIETVKKHFILIAVINITTGLSWMFEFIALKSVSAAVVNSFSYGIIPIVIAATTLTKTNRKSIFFDFICIALISISLFLIALIRINYTDIPGDQYQLILGTLISLIGGIFCGINILLLKKMYITKLDTISIMKIRFPLLIIISGIYLCFHSNCIILSSLDYVKMVILSFTTIIMPLWFLQEGVKRSKPLSVSMLLASIPAVTFFIQLLEPNAYFSYKIMIIVLILSLSIAVGVIKDHKMRGEKI